MTVYPTTRAALGLVTTRAGLLRTFSGHQNQRPSSAAVDGVINERHGRRTRAAIIAATASVLAVNRTAKLPEIATAAGVGRTTLHRYFADRERVVYEATLHSIGVLSGVVNEAAVDQGPAVDAMRRVITALVSVGDRLVFLFGDPSLRNVAPTDQPNDDMIMRLIKRGQREGSFDPELSATWSEHSLFGLLLKGCEDAGSGKFPRHTVAPLIIRTFERGICPLH